MKNLVKLQSSKSGIGIVNVQCANCKIQTKHNIIVSVSYNDSDDCVWWCGEYQILHCLGCDNVIFRQSTMFSEDEEFTEDGYRPVERVTIYPTPNGDLNRESIIDDFDDSVPKELKEIYYETLRSLNSVQPILTSIGIRTIVEAVCKERNTTGNNLKERIDNLVTQDILTKRGAEVLHNLRDMGNNAAHEMKLHTRDLLSCAMDVVDHLLRDVYIIPNQVRTKFGK